jgi:protein ImuB
MRIPSYDDLIPSIPDISPGETLTSVSTLLPAAGPVAERAVTASASTHHLYAALYDDYSRGSSANSDPRSANPGSSANRESRTASLFTIARDFSPRIERRADRTIVLDVAGLQRLIGPAEAIARELHRAGAPRVAIATSQIAAMLLVRARPGITVAIGDPEAALGEVSIAVLQQLLTDMDAATAPAAKKRASDDAVRERTSAPHDGPLAATRPLARTFDVLRRWGVTTIGEFAALPAAALSARLGSAGVAIHRLARGIDPRPLVPDPGVPRFTGSFELEWPIDTLEPLSFVFARVLDPIAAALERADRGAVAINLALRLTDRTSHMRTLQLPAAMRDPRVLRTLLLLDLESHPPSAAVDVVALELDPAPARIVQYSLLERAVPSPETLATLMARLGALVGETRCGSPVLLDTHRPDGFVMGPVGFQDGGRANQSSVASAFRRKGGAHLPALREPHPSTELGVTLSESKGQGRPEHGRGTAEAGSHPDDVWAPDHPPAILRRFRPPVAVRVAVEGVRPVRVATDRRGMPGGIVQESAGPWRSSGGWWEGERWNRDEWDVALSDGAICRLVRDRDHDRWFMEGLYD